MEVGQFGVFGALAANPVGLVRRSGLEAARSLHRVLAGKHAQEKRGKADGVIQIHARVS